VDVASSGLERSTKDLLNIIDTIYERPIVRSAGLICILLISLYYSFYVATNAFGELGCRGAALLLLRRVVAALDPQAQLIC